MSREAVLGFLSLYRDGELSLNFERADPHGVNTAYSAAMATMFAAWLIAFVGGDSATLTELDRLSDELLLPLNADPNNAQTEEGDRRVSRPRRSEDKTPNRITSAALR